MGGVITFIYRTKEGWFSNLRWTGSIAHMIYQAKFFSCDTEYIQSLIDRPSYLYEKDPEYTQPFAPDEYGIIICDFVEKNILSVNNYSIIGQVTIDTFTHPDGVFMTDYVRPSQQENFLELWSLGKIKGVMLHKFVDKKLMGSFLEPIEYNCKTLDDFTDILQKLEDLFFGRQKMDIDPKDIPYPAYVEIDMSPFNMTVNNLVKVKSLLEAKKYLEEHECPLTDNDLMLWKEKIEYYEEVEPCEK